MSYNQSCQYFCTLTNSTHLPLASSKPQCHSESDAPYNDKDATLESCQNELLILEREPSIILEKLPEQHRQQRANILSKLHNEPASIHLRAYFKRLEEGSPTWDIDTFIEGAKCFANLGGPGRAEYYDKTLKGLQYIIQAHLLYRSVESSIAYRVLHIQ